MSSALSYQTPICINQVAWLQGWGEKKGKRKRKRRRRDEYAYRSCSLYIWQVAGYRGTISSLREQASQEPRTPAIPVKFNLSRPLNFSNHYPSVPIKVRCDFLSSTVLYSILNIWCIYTLYHPFRTSEITQLELVLCFVGTTTKVPFLCCKIYGFPDFDRIPSIAGALP